MRRPTSGVRDVWLRCDRWPDARDLASWARDVFRIEAAQTPQEQAIALYRWALICVGRNGPPAHEGERGREAYLMDTLKYLTVYGAHYCDGLSRVMINAWQAAGGRARKVVICRLGHTIAELRYRDADGSTRWHAFDPQHGWYVFARDGGHIASIAEIDAEPELLLQPEDPPRPWFYAESRRERYRSREGSTRDPAIGRAPAPQHRMQQDLRPGERWTRRWEPGPQYWPYCFGERPLAIAQVWEEEDIRGGGIADSFLGEHVEPYLHPAPEDWWLLHAEERSARCRMPGTVETVYDVPLAGGAYRGGVSSVTGLRAEPAAAADRALLHPERRGQVGELIIAVQTPYVITDAWIDAIVRPGRTAQDMLAMHVSVDGGASWQQVWGNAFAHEQRPDGAPRPVRAAFGAEAYHDGRFSVVGRYAYLIRIEMLTRGDIGSVGLDRLCLHTVSQCGMLALPALQPGRNEASVRGRSGADDVRLQVDYRWSEDGRERNFRETLPGDGGEFTIDVAVDSPRDIRMREVTLRCLSA